MIKSKPIIILLAAFVAFTVRGAQRVSSGLLVIYDFSAAQGASVKDRSGVQPMVDLRIVNPQNVRRMKGSLEIRKNTIIRSDKVPSKILNAIKRSNEITIEAWVKPANLRQDGPARIVTLSKNSSERNITIGQEAGSLQARLRTTRTSKNGMPAISTGRSLSTRPTHIVYSRDRSGRTTVYLNGKRTKEQTVAGVMTNWDGSHHLALGNELSNDRPWLGTYYLVAIYNRDLSAAEVAQNFTAGLKAEIAPVASAPTSNAHLFESRIAPLIAKHCLECHDSATHKGKLDLSRQATAFAGGETIVPGKSAKSRIWEMVGANKMPRKRPPLSATEKAALKQWVDGGAKWTINQIDPAVYVHTGRSTQNWVRRLTMDEYIATVRATTDIDIAGEARELLPPDLRADGFSNTAYNLNVDLKHVNAYAQLADIIVKRMDAQKFAARFSGKRRFTDKDMRALIERMGKWLLRGPLEEREVVVYRGITTTVVANGGNFEEAVGLVLEAMLQSPRFVYRMENQRGDGTVWPVNDHELASRLSYIIWGAPPDEALYQAADKGGLGEDAQLESQVRRMLKDPRTIDRSVQFISEWIDLDRLKNLRPNTKKFPHWNPTLATDMRQETIAFFREIVWKQNRPLSDLFNAQLTFLTPRLARHYRIPNPKAGDGAARYDLTGVSSRGGLLTQGSLLTMGGDEASMVSRGLFVMHDLLRGTVINPPPDVDSTPVPSKPGLTQRGVAEDRLNDAKCGGCHGKFEPLAFGLEKFDGLGAFFDKDQFGNRLRDDGEILFPGEAKPIAYKNSAELMNLLAGSDRVQKSITWKLTQFALGRPLGPSDARIVDKIHETAQKNGGTYTSLITAIVLSDLVQTTQTVINE